MIVQASTLNELEDGINRTASVGFTLASSIHGLRVRVSDLDAEPEFKLVVVMEWRKRCLARATGHSVTTETYISMPNVTFHMTYVIMRLNGGMLKEKRTSERTWIVEGETANYIVWFDENREGEIVFKCTCPYYTRHKGRLCCKHIKLVLMPFKRKTTTSL